MMGVSCTTAPLLQPAVHNGPKSYAIISFQIHSSHLTFESTRYSQCGPKSLSSPFMLFLTYIVHLTYGDYSAKCMTSYGCSYCVKCICNCIKCLQCTLNNPLSSIQVWCFPISRPTADTTSTTRAHGRSVRSRTPRWPPSTSSSSPGRRASTGATRAGWRTGRSSTRSPSPGRPAVGTTWPPGSAPTADGTTTNTATTSSASPPPSAVRRLS